MKLFWLLLSLMPGIPLHAWQSTTPQAALEEIASTTKPEVIASHLPDPIQKSIEALPKLKKQAILDKLMEMKSSWLQDCTVRPAHDSDGWEIIDEDGDVKGRVRLENAFISGVDAMLTLRIESDGSSRSFIVTMHLEDNEWRIDDLGSWEKTDLGLAKLVHEPTEMEKNEAAARETLQTICQAVQRYARAHPQIGYPSSLKPVLARPPAPLPLRGFGLLDQSFAGDPLIRNGYRFLYLQTQVGNGTSEELGSFSIAAVPEEFGRTGVRSFFIDETSRIRSTRENRPATDRDASSEDQ